MSAGAVHASVAEGRGKRIQVPLIPPAVTHSPTWLTTVKFDGVATMAGGVESNTFTVMVSESPFM